MSVALVGAVIVFWLAATGYLWRVTLVLLVLLGLLVSAAIVSAEQGWYLIYPPVKPNVSDAAWERINRELDKGSSGSAEVVATWWLDFKLPLNKWPTILGGTT